MEIDLRSLVEVTLWLVGVVFMAGVYVTTVRRLRDDILSLNERVDEVEAAGTEGRARLWTVVNAGSPAVLAHLEAIEKAQARQESRLDQLFTMLTNLQTSLIERLTEKAR